MTWKVALVTHGALVVAWLATLIVYAVKLHRSRKETKEAKVNVRVERVRANNAEAGLAACKDKLEVGGMSDDDLSDAVHDALRRSDPSDGIG